MLVLSRRKNERIVIAGNIFVTVVATEGGRVRLGIEAPEDVRVLREEVAERIRKEGPCSTPPGSSQST
jgi:carbon storage regulator